MSLLRFASLVVLALWVGGLATLGLLAAPAIFDVLEAHDPATGRTLAAQVFGTVFGRFQRAAWVLGALLLALNAARALLGPRPRRMALRVWAVMAMVGMSLVGALVIAPRIETIRQSTSGAVASLPDTDPRKGEFGRLHGLSNGLMLLTLLTGAGLIWAEMKDPG
jgi:hypothetical protein